MTDITQMRTWAEINLDAMEHNYHIVRGLLPQSCRFLGVIKADAYGHGAVQVAKKLQALGADMLAVASAAEGLRLRQAGITLPVLCLGQTPPELARLLVDYDITQTVEDLETGRILSQAAQAAGKTLNIHVKLDTGMSRLGFFWRKGEDNTALLDDITALCALPGLNAEGMFTHFSDADGSESYTMGQLERYLEAKAALEARGVRFEICHCSSSAAVLNYPCAYMDMVRPGVVLYGYYPAPGMEWMNLGLKPVMTVKSRVSSVRSLPAGTYISYGRTAALSRDSRLAVMPIGYGDGYSRKLSNQMYMLIHDVPCPVVGRVCMDMCMVDVTDVPDVKAGDVAVVYGGGMAEQAAALAGSIVCEVICNVSPRVPRLYLEHGVRIG